MGTKNAGAKRAAKKKVAKQPKFDAQGSEIHLRASKEGEIGIEMIGNKHELIALLACCLENQFFLDLMDDAVTLVCEAEKEAKKKK